MIYCKECGQKCESTTIYDCCGERVISEDLDYNYCRYCGQHTTFAEVSDCCGADVADSDFNYLNIKTTEGNISIEPIGKN